MRVPARFAIGASTHTGLVRGANEDDYLVVAPESDSLASVWVAVADGLGGAAGGAEASRTGLRAFAVAALDGAAEDLEQRVRRAFVAASNSVREQSAVVPALRGMATTLVAAAFASDRAMVGHVGDSRAYLLRGGALRRLTEDHASKDDRNRLLRCLGGSVDQTADVTSLALEDGDRLMLCSDGVWGYVPESSLLESLGARDPQAAAGKLVAAALQRGGPDNATAIVVDVVPGAEPGKSREVDLPREEAPQQEDLGRVGRLGAPRWPAALLGASLLLAVAAASRVVFDFDVFAWARAAF